LGIRNRVGGRNPLPGIFRLTTRATKPRRLRHLTAVAPARKIPAALLALALLGGRIEYVGRTGQALPVPPLTLGRATAQAPAIKPPAAGGAVDDKAVHRFARPVGSRPQYVKCVSSILPRAVSITTEQAVQELTDEQLVETLRAIREQLSSSQVN